MNNDYMEWAIRLALVLGSLILIDVFMGIVLPYLDIPTQVGDAERHLYDPYRGHKLNPDYHRPQDTDGRKIHSPNGFREDYRVKKDPSSDTYRIIAMGGSAMYGIGAGGNYPQHRSLFNDETIDHYLQQRINKRLRNTKIDTRVEIINAGVTAYNTHQHLVYLNESLYEYDPDLVLFFDGHNDFYISNPSYNHWLDYRYSSTNLTYSYNRRQPFFTAYTMSRYLARYSNTFLFMEKVFQNFWQRYEYRPHLGWDEKVITAGETDQFSEIYRQTARKTFLREYVQIQRLSNYFGFDMMIFLQPEVVFEHKENLGQSDQQILRTTRKLRNKRLEGYVETKKQIREELPALFEEANLPFFDVSEIGPHAPRDRQLYLDYTHLSPGGTRTVAKLIDDRLWPLIRRKLELNEKS